MKKLILGLSFLVFAATTTFVACKKDEKSSNAQSTSLNTDKKPKEISLNNNTLFIINGDLNQKLTYQQYKKRIGSLLKTTTADESNIVLDYQGENYIFETDLLLKNWAIANNYQEFLDKLNEIESWQTYATNRNIIDNIEETDNFSDSLLNATMAVQNNQPVILVTALYQHIHYGGGMVIFPWGTPRPSLGAFNGQGSSLADFFIPFKVNTLCSNTWFRGSKMWYTSWKLIPDFTSIGYNDKAHSKL